MAPVAPVAPVGPALPVAPVAPVAPCAAKSDQSALLPLGSLFVLVVVASQVDPLCCTISFRAYVVEDDSPPPGGRTPTNTRVTQFYEYAQ